MAGVLTESCRGCRFLILERFAADIWGLRCTCQDIKPPFRSGRTLSTGSEKQMRCDMMLIRSPAWCPLEERRSEC